MSVGPYDRYKFSHCYILRYHLLHSFSVCIILYTLFFLLITEGTVYLTMEDVLFFTTGIRSVPPAGFETKPCVTFQHGSDCRFPQAIDQLCYQLYVRMTSTSYETQKHRIHTCSCTACHPPVFRFLCFGLCVWDKEYAGIWLCVNMFCLH